MKKYFISFLVVPFLFYSFLGVFMILPALADSNIYTPIANGDLGNFRSEGTNPTSECLASAFNCVNINDGTETIRYQNNSNPAIETYFYGVTPQDGTIDNVKICSIMMQVGGDISKYARNIITTPQGQVSGFNYTFYLNSFIEGERCDNFTTNPLTGQNWTWSELQGKNGFEVEGGHGMAITYTYMQIDWAQTPTPTPVPTPTPSPTPCPTPTPTPSPTPTPTPSPTPMPTLTPIPTPTPTPSDNELLQSILSETQSIKGFISDIVAKLATIIGNMANLATENTLGLIKIKTDNLDTPLSNLASETTLQAVNISLGDLGTKLLTIIGSLANLATENTLGLIKIKTDNLDTNLSSRASESTLSGVKLQTDKLNFDFANNLKITGTLSSTWEAGTALGHGFITTTDDTVLSINNETDFLLIQNPSSSSKKVRLNKILIGVAGGVSNQGTTLRVYRNPLVNSSGATLTVSNLLSSGGSTTIQAFKLPTISVRGTNLDSIKIGTTGREINYGLGFFIVPGESILVTLQADVPNTSNTLSLTWLEE